MVKVFGVFVAGCAATICATPAVAAELTPDGAASLINRNLGPAVAAAFPPSVLTEVQVTVGEGGRAGTVRVLAAAARAGEPFEPMKFGPAVTLPAEPGTYTLPAPRVHANGFTDLYRTQIGLMQETGGHAIVDARPCDPGPIIPSNDPCQTMFIDGWPGGTRAGALLAIQSVYELDRDRDLRGDQTEDRTDLRVRATTVRGANGLQRTTIEVTNAGPIPADVPLVRAELPTGRTADWEGGCPAPLLWLGRREGWCYVPRLAPGASHTLVLRSDTRVLEPIKLLAEAEGPDLAPADNGFQLNAVGEAPVALTVAVDGEPSLRRGIKLRLTSGGPTRVTAAFKVRGRTLRIARDLRLGGTRTVTLRATGAKLRSLKRAAKGKSLQATITVRGGGGTSATTTAQVTR